MTTQDDHEWIYVNYITLRDSRRVNAAAKGLKAFRIRVRRRPPPKNG